QSWGEFETRVDAASRPTFREVMILFGVLLLICICGMLWGWSSRETSEGRRTSATRGQFHFWPSAVTVTAGSICLLAVPSVATWTIPATKDVIARLHKGVVNARGMRFEER